MPALNTAIIEHAMGAEMNLHPRYPLGQPKAPGQVNERNGASGKTVITDRPIQGDVPRDRDGNFELILILSMSAVSPASTNASSRCMRMA